MSIYAVERWEEYWVVTRNGFDLRDRRETPRKRIAALIAYADEHVASQVAFILNTQTTYEAI